MEADLSLLPLLVPELWSHRASICTLYGYPMLAAFEHNPSPILTLTREGGIVDTNRAARAIGFETGTDLAEAHPTLAALPQIGATLPQGQRVSVPLSVDHGSVSLDQAEIVAVEAEGGAALIVFLRLQSTEELAGSLIRRIVAHTSGAGQTYFEQLVVHLATKLQTRWAAIALFQSERGEIETIAVCEQGSIAPNFSYPISGAPCELVIQGQPCYYPLGVAELFPEDRFLVDHGVEAYVGVPLSGPDGAPLGLVILMHDAPLDPVTDPTAFLSLFAGRTATEISRVQAQQEARRQAAFAQKLLDQVGALVLLLDGRGNVIRSNRMTEHVTGWSEAALAGRPLWETLAGPIAETTLTHLGERGATSVNEQWHTPMGEVRHIRWEVEQVDGPHDRSFMLVTGLDLTTLEATRVERDRLHERLRDAQRLEALGRLAGGVAHDFNNLLLAIMGYADLIEMDAPEGDDIQMYAAEIRRASDQAAGMTRQLLAFGRRQRLERRELDVTDLVDGAAKILQPLLGDDITLRVERPSQEMHVVADPGRLENVIMNLGINARDAMPLGGTITVKAGPLLPGELPEEVEFMHGVYIDVSDEGTGIPEDVLPHIFDPFFTTKELGRGTGLGLASVYGTVQQHGGIVQVKTDSARGTTIRICLPRAHTAGMGPQDASGEQAARSGGRILIAEDDRNVRHLVTRILTKAGYDVVACDDGQYAKDALAASGQPYDLVVADVLMPRVGGVELCEHLRSHYPETRVLLTSGFVAESNLPEGIRLVQKPYLPADLLRQIGQELGRR